LVSFSIKVEVRGNTKVGKDMLPAVVKSVFAAAQLNRPIRIFGLFNNSWLYPDH